MISFFIYDVLLFCLILITNSFACKLFRIELNNYKYQYIDSVRGLCAVLVVLHHLYFRAGTPDNHINWDLNSYSFISQIYIVYLGTIGVSIFFIISGFLFYPVAKKKGVVLRFLWSRFLRIYPPVFCSLLIVFFVLIIINHFMYSSCYFNVFKYIPTPFGYIGNDLTCGYNRANLNSGVLWTIIWEVRLYIFIPILMVVLQVVRNDWLVILGLITLLICLRFFNIITLNELSYMLLFVVGFICYLLQDKNIRYLSLLFYFGIILTPLTFLITRTHYNPLLPFTLLPTFLAIVKGYNFFSILANKHIQLLGVTSFSIYLNHGVFQLISKYYLYDYGNALWQIISCILIGIVAPIFYKVVESRYKAKKYLIK